ncbi:hypothetical protein HDU90_003101 [Geranomyces variabilis]|nr:hypothetical protein HDU90_003101 [Geranomyces variabilis]
MPPQLNIETILADYYIDVKGELNVTDWLEAAGWHNTDLLGCLSATPEAFYTRKRATAPSPGMLSILADGVYADYVDNVAFVKDEGVHLSENVKQLRIAVALRKPEALIATVA